MQRLFVTRVLSLGCALIVCALLVMGLARQVAAQVPLPPPMITVFPAANAVAGNVVPGTDLIRYPLAGPNVVCNDGTTPVMYLRRWTNQADRDKWLIYLDGGGSCQDGQDCVDRWTSSGNQPNFGLQKMSTSIPVNQWGGANPPTGWTQQGAFYRVPPGIQGRGILSPNPANNPFAGWNIVFAYYCSSDSWSGEATNQTLNASGQDYRIHFRGATIFDAIIAQLRSGATVYQHQGIECAMPDLDNAEMVLLGGTSAGGNGVKHNLDRLRDLLRADHPQMDVRGVIDAAGSPTREFLAWNGAPPQDSYANTMQSMWSQYTSVWNHRGDASCLALNALEPWRCADSTHVMRHHITTPFFHRMDLQDSNALESFLIHYSPTTARYEFAVHTSAQLHELSDLLGVLAPRYPAEAASIQADPLWLPPGVYGPRCTDHVGLTGYRTFVAQRIPNALGVMRSFSETLYRWVNITPGSGVPSPELVAVSGIGPAGPAQCP